MRRLLVLFLLGALSAPAADAQRPDAALDVEHYVFRLTLSDATDAIEGEADVTVRFVQGGTATVALDLVGPARGGRTGMTVEAVTQDGQAVPFAHADDRLTLRLPAPPPAGALHTYTIRYRGVPADGLIIDANKHGDRTFFGDNWPDRARHWLPSVDHPSDKATVAFIVVAPDHYQVVGSGALVEEADLGDGRRRTHWRTTAPLATKVMVIGAARFAVQMLDEVAGVPVQSWVYPQDRDAGFFDFALAAPITAFFIDRLGPFPYEKLANVQSKTRYGGMENASNIFYNENAVTGTRSSEGLLAHEIAHQWFGDAVTEADWPHLWLSEGFATYLTQLYLEATYGRDRLIDGMRNARNAVRSYDDQAPDDPVVDTTYATVLSLLNTNAYQKGAWVLHMLRHRLGDDVFWDGLATFYRRYRDANATTADFRRVMEAASGQDLTAFFRQWLHRPGHPRLSGTWHYEAGQLTVTLAQEGPLFDVPVEVGVYTRADARPRIEVIPVSGATHTVSLPLATRPTAVVLDPGVWLLMEADFREQ